MEVLITGASGFVGRHLVEYCAGRGASVTGVARRAPLGTAPVAGLSEFTQADLLDADQASSAVVGAAPERVFHLAAEPSVARSWHEPSTFLVANVLATLNVLEAVREHAPGARVLVACSGEEYGKPERLPVTEEAALRPQNPYAVSKASADLLAGLYQDAHGLHVVRTRAFNHAGPGQSETYVVSGFARQIAEAEMFHEPGAQVEIRTGDITVRRDFTDVRDVVRAYWDALEEADAGVYNVSAGSATAITDILAGLCAHTKLRVVQRTEPTLLRKHDVMEIYASHDKLTQAIGWQPEIPLEKTLRDTLDWWRAEVGAKVAS